MGNRWFDHSVGGLRSAGEEGSEPGRCSGLRVCRHFTDRVPGHQHLEAAMSDDETRLHGSERRKGYTEIKRTVDERMAYLERRFKHWLVLGLVAFGIIGLASTVALIGYGYVLRQASKDRLEACENRNDRHDNALNALIVGSNQDIENAPTEAAKNESRRRRDVTIGIINGVAPKVV